MQITRQSEYAIKTLIEIAKAPFGEVLSTKFIAEQQDIPEDFLKKTIKLLSMGDLVTTQRGTRGGVRLAKPAEKITVADIVSSIEGPIALNVCLSPGYECPNKSNCKVSGVLAKAQHAMLKELKNVTLDELV
ncbi:hypothetical protein SYNTR_1084 [Candidatus Syntrophocurvum alkaliphilum]|uniref:Rrf2 family transcriptional regulator n=1 Tax=Candidatus Syntrophocurvum alkaliphilum TaxID=2293317 RepID=A0A6I6DEX8_9FIRM|nr:Rrf2 family transcriptional regulator [Candidatus Syntrophocurvum alkaliphilum]QGT99677.1 hypothetical protein SYNTR_1084 [Candidatus Syntrophocurvum alkaliphilum]